MTLAAALPLLGGCAAPDGADEDGGEAVGEARQAQISNNQLSSNALSHNELSRNELSRNELSRNQLSANELSRNAMSAEGLSLQLLKYMIRCAMPDSVCLDFPTTASDADVPSECVDGTCHFCGNLGMAPGWQTAGLTLSEERWVSACLLAHVNLDGVSVPISVRDSVSGRLAPVVRPESQQFRSSEAAFYGNVFRPGPSGEYEKYVCNAGASTAPPGRVCGLSAAQALDCFMTFTGSCIGTSVNDGDDDLGNGPPVGSGACNLLDSRPNAAVGQCHGAQGGTWAEVLTVFDQRSCGNGVCSGSETPAICPQDCNPRGHGHSGN